jgi:hypothetical protein
MDKLKLQNEKHDKYVDKTCGKKEKKIQYTYSPYVILGIDNFFSGLVRYSKNNFHDL